MADDPLICSICGTELPPNTTEESCPVCSLRLALGTDDTPHAADVEADPSAIQRIGNYELVEELARGGMGIVYLARHTTLKRNVALKMILTGNLSGRSTLQRFQVEAEATARLEHPAIVPIHEIGQYRGHRFLVMQLVEGGNLAERIRDGSVEPGLAAEWISRIARAVHYAHQRGVLHRDLKPANILLNRDGQPMVTDFGLAKLIEDDSGLTLSTAHLGTPSYMSPEQAGDGAKKATTASDIYSLGAILYELLVGAPPFRGDSSAQTILKVIQENPRAPRQRNPSIDRDLETVCLEALNKDPARRYPSAEALADDLDRWRAGCPILARPVGMAGKLRRWCRRQPLLASLSVAVILLCLGGIVFGVLALRRIAQEQEAMLRESYYSKISLAKNLIDAGDIRQAREVLFSCPELHRHWEWGHLLFLCHQEMESFQIATHGRSNWVERLEFREGNTRLTAYSDDGAFVDWRLAGSGSKVAPAPPWHETNRAPAFAVPAQVIETVYSPDGKVAATLEPGNLARLWWDTDRSRSLVQLRGMRKAVIPALVFSPDNEILFSGGLSGNAKLWKVADGSEIHTFAHATFHAVFSPGGDRVATLGQDYTIRIYDSATGGELRALRGHTSELLAAAFSPDGRLIASADVEGEVKVWSARIGRQRVSHPMWTSGMALGPEAKKAVTVQWDSSITLWDLESGANLQAFYEPFQRSYNAAFSPDGSQFAVGGATKRVEIYDAETCERVHSLAGHTGVIWWTTFSPNGRWIASGSADRTVRIWDASSGAHLTTLAGHESSVGVVQFSPDSALLATVATMTTSSRHGRATVRLWDTTTWELVRTLEPFPCSTWYLRFSPDGSVLAASAADGWIHLVEVATGRPLRSLKARAISGPIDFSTDGRRLIRASSDTNPAKGYATVEIWDPHSGFRLLTLFQGSHEAVDPGIAFSRDDRRLILSTSRYPIRQIEAFPWRTTDYPDPDRDAELRERVERFAADYWWRRVRLEEAKKPLRLPSEYPRLPPTTWLRRNPDLPDHLIDLTAHYNGLLDVPWLTYFMGTQFDNDLSSLPRGTEPLGGVAFDLRGLIRLGHQPRPEDPMFHFVDGVEAPRFPREVVGITVGVRCRRIHVLHGLHHHQPTPDGTAVAAYVLHYADGASARFEMIKGAHLLNWWTDDPGQASDPNTVIAWRGGNPAADRAGQSVQLTRTTLENPFPEREVVSVDLVSLMTPATVFVIALTADID